VSFLQIIVLSAAGIATMRAALERGDVDEAARQGALAGPVIVERALGAADRLTRLAAIAAAPLVEDRAELLDALARAAGGPDRRTAIPAAVAARAIARELAADDRPDHIAADDVATWRSTWATLALRTDRWIELRLLALDTASALDQGRHGGAGVELGAALRDPDPAFRRAVASVIALPAPPATHAALVDMVIRDPDPGVALAAAQTLCMSLSPSRAGRPILDALGGAGLARIRTLVAGDRTPVARDAARCVAAASPSAP
jgi:hypothetical protein